MILPTDSSFSPLRSLSVSPREAGNYSLPIPCSTFNLSDIWSYSILDTSCLHLCNHLSFWVSPCPFDLFWKHICIVYLMWLGLAFSSSNLYIKRQVLHICSITQFPISSFYWVTHFCQLLLGIPVESLTANPIPHSKSLSLTVHPCSSSWYRGKKIPNCWCPVHVLQKQRLDVRENGG